MKRNFNMIIFIICYIAYTAIYIGRLNLTTATPVFIEGSFLSQEQIGTIGSVFFVIYAIGRIVNGYIGDKTPPWIMISTGLFISGISNIIIGFLPPYLGIMLLWGANAYAQSMLWSSLIRIVSQIYSPAKAKKKISYMVTSVATGNILGIIISTLIIDKIGLRFAFIIPGLIVILLCLAVILTTRRVKCQTIEIKHISMLNLIKEKKIRAITLPTVFHGIIKDNISLWMTVFFVEQYGIDLNKSAYFVLFIPIIGFVGRMLYPLFYKLCREKEHTVSTYAFLLCVFATIPLLLKATPPMLSAICLGLLYAAVSVINTSMLSIFPLQFTKSGNQASVSGMMDFFTYFGAGIGSLLFGYFIKGFGYHSVFIVFTLLAATSLLIIIKNKSLLEKED